MMQQVLRSFPDDKPITSICVVEDQSKCPPGFYVVSKTHDQDSDADLWKELTFFGRKVTRYLCLSKSEGIADYIVENVNVIGEKEIPPDGYCLIPKTIDSEQKSWRKRQLCYRMTRKNLATSAITDIIILSRARKAPDGFSLAGDINGMALCFKTGNPTVGSPQSNSNNRTPQLGYNLNPRVSEEITPPAAHQNGVSYPQLNSPTHDYENLIRVVPIRKAPKPPVPTPPNTSNYATLATYQGLEGIPFVINPGLNLLSKSTDVPQIPVIKPKTRFQLDEEYKYDFRLELQYLSQKD